MRPLHGHTPVGSCPSHEKVGHSCTWPPDQHCCVCSHVSVFSGGTAGSQGAPSVHPTPPVPTRGACLAAVHFLYVRNQCDVLLLTKVRRLHEGSLCGFLPWDLTTV